MIEQDPWIHFPGYLSPPTVRSLSLSFVIEELAERIEQSRRLEESDDKSLERNSFFSLSKPYPVNTMFPNKLCFYCDILLQTSSVGETTLLDELNQMRMFMLEARAFLTLEKEALGSSFFQAFRGKISSVFSLLLPFLFEARSDENVLIKLLELRNTFDYALGLGTIQAMLQSFFPEGHTYLRTLIHEGLTRRNFTPFLLEKESLIDTIEWDSTCQQMN